MVVSPAFLGARSPQSLGQQLMKKAKVEIFIG